MFMQWRVVGIDHPKYGAVGVAFVDTDADTAALEPELRVYAREHLALFQCPGDHIFSCPSTNGREQEPEKSVRKNFENWQ